MKLKIKVHEKNRADFNRNLIVCHYDAQTSTGSLAWRPIGKTYEENSDGENLFGHILSYLSLQDIIWKLEKIKFNKVGFCWLSYFAYLWARKALNPSRRELEETDFPFEYEKMLREIIEKCAEKYLKKKEII